MARHLDLSRRRTSRRIHGKRIDFPFEFSLNITRSLQVKVWEHYQSIRNATIFYVDGSKYKITIDNLFKNRNYKLRVQAWSLGGEGKYSSPEKEFRFGKFDSFERVRCLIFLLFTRRGRASLNT